MRLINADVFEELFDKQIEYGATDIFDAVEDALQDAPTIDAVPVVRCRDCQYGDQNTCGDRYCCWQYISAQRVLKRRRNAMNLNDLRDAVYEDAVAHGLWEDAEKFAEEFAEKESMEKFYEAANLVFFESEEILTAVEEYNYDNAIEELADTVIMCMSAAGYLGIDIDAAVRRKMEINKNRPWKHGK